MKYGKYFKIAQVFVYDFCENARDNFDRAPIYVNSFKDNKFKF